MWLRVVFECLIVSLSGGIVYLGYLAVGCMLFGKGSSRFQHPNADAIEYFWRSQKWYKQMSALPLWIAEDREAAEILKKLQR